MENVSSKLTAPIPQNQNRDALAVEIRIAEVGNDVAADREGVKTTLPPAQGKLVQWFVLFTVLLLAGLYVGVHIGNGWVPADEGTLAQSALRVLNGQLPHRDFTEIYTGGLSFIHALAFHVLGVNLMSLRICVFLFFLTWIPAVYYIALRFASPLVAGVLTLLAVSWSFPNYPAAMPSWYNLFFATFGAAALLRYLEVRTQRWLFVAGLCGGVSILFKVIGAYYIAAVLLILAFLEQNSHNSTEGQKQSAPFRAFKSISLFLFLATLIYFLRSRLGSGEIYNFVAPAVILAAILLSEGKVHARTAARFRALFSLALPFIAGVLAPVLLFLVPYARSGAIGVFFSGITSSVASRSVGLAVLRPPGFERSIYGLVLIGLLAAAIYAREFQSKSVGAALGLGFVALLLDPIQAIRSGVWYSVATLTPLVVLAGAILLIRGLPELPARLQRERIMVLISVAALCSLVQYPFAAPIYLSYSLPLTLLAALAIIASAKKRPGTYVLASVMGFYLLFGVELLVPDYIYELTHKIGTMSELHLQRAGGLRIEFAPSFEELIGLVRQHSPNGLMYAANDCPELYFLSGLENVTRDDSGAPADEVLNALRTNDVKVVVINEAPFFPAGRMSPEIRAEVVQRFPEQKMIGIFHVFWRP